jgi:FMN phosphatase YigB (HAD superfamily)
MQVGAADTMYAGDIPNVDVDGARAAGLDAVLIDTLSHYPDYTGAPRFVSVAALVEALCG